MEWSDALPRHGDIIRVKVKFYHHYGIFADEKTVIQFGRRDNSGLAPEEIRVLVTDIDEFCGGNPVETGKLDRRERAARRSAGETVAYALSRVGTGGYHILHNNCEHFAQSCLFGEGKSSFVDGVRSRIRQKLGK